MGTIGAARVRREPEATVLFHLVQAEWQTFVQRAEAADRVVPRFCIREAQGFLRCGVLAHGFARVVCDGCKREEVVAFSCKGRGFCPSCGTRRMVDTAAWLVERVIPEVPVRQWVLSLPHRVRVLCAYDPVTCAGVRRILVRAVSGFYEAHARRLGLRRPRTGAVAFLQRFDSALRLNLHLHVLWLDGVYVREAGRGRAEFVPHGEVTDADVAKLVRAVRGRVRRYLRRRGQWPAEECAAEPGEVDALLELSAAAAQGRAAIGERAGQRDVRVGSGTRSEPFLKAPLCADLDGFSLHAAVCVTARDRERLERLCRYAGRPAVAESRLALLPDGRVAYSFKKRWQDGTKAVVMDKQVLMERLCALVPRPRKHLVTYHGVLAPAAGLRPQVVPQVDDEDVDEGQQEARACEHREVRGVGGPGGVDGGGAQQATRAQRRVDADVDRAGGAAVARRVVPHAPGKRRRGGRKRYSWAELLRRVWLIEVLVCPHCSGRRRLLAAIHDPESIARVLGAMGLSAAGEPGPPRAPPSDESPE